MGELYDLLNTTEEYSDDTLHRVDEIIPDTPVEELIQCLSLVYSGDVEASIIHSELIRRRHQFTFLELKSIVTDPYVLNFIHLNHRIHKIDLTGDQLAELIVQAVQRYGEVPLISDLEHLKENLNIPMDPQNVDDLFSALAHQSPLNIFLFIQGGNFASWLMNHVPNWTGEDRARYYLQRDEVKSAHKFIRKLFRIKA